MMEKEESERRERNKRREIEERKVKKRGERKGSVKGEVQLHFCYCFYVFLYDRKQVVTTK